MGVIGERVLGTFQRAASGFRVPGMGMGAISTVYMVSKDTGGPRQKLQH